MVAAVVLAYLLGSIPTGLWVVRWRAHLDVRTVGSGNIGATNVARAAGRGAGAAVLLLDIGKGLLAVLLIARSVAGDASPMVPVVTPTEQFACGFAAVLGHVFPVWLGFRGGKGVATTIGMLLGAEPLLGAIFLGVWLAVFLMWRYVSVSSMAAVVSVPITQWLVGSPPASVALGLGLSILIVARHRENLRRLRQGTEHQAPFGRGN